MKKTMKHLLQLLFTLPIGCVLLLWIGIGVYSFATWSFPDIDYWGWTRGAIVIGFGLFVSALLPFLADYHEDNY